MSFCLTKVAMSTRSSLLTITFNLFFFVKATFAFSPNCENSLEMDCSLLGTSVPVALSAIFGEPSPLESTDVGVPYLVLKEYESVNEHLRTRRATGNVYIDRNDLVHSRQYVVRVKIDSTRYAARSHRDDPLWFGHLVIYHSEARRHLSRHCSVNHYEVALPQRTERFKNTEPLRIEPWTGDSSKLNAATRCLQMNWPQRIRPAPVCQVRDWISYCLLDYFFCFSNEDAQSRSVPARSRALLFLLTSTRPNLLGYQISRFPAR